MSLANKPLHIRIQRAWSVVQRLDSIRRIVLSMLRNGRVWRRLRKQCRQAGRFAPSDVSEQAPGIHSIQ